MSFLDLFRRRETPRDPIPTQVPALACRGCNQGPRVVEFSPTEITVVCLNDKCPKPDILAGTRSTPDEAVEAWNEMVAPPEGKQRENIAASGSRSHFQRG